MLTSNSQAITTAMGTLVSFEVEYLRNYIETVKGALDKTEQEFVARVEAKAAAMPEEHRPDWYEWNSDEYHEITEVFPSILRASALVTAYSVFEHGLARMATTLDKHEPPRPKRKKTFSEVDKLRAAIEAHVACPCFTSPEWSRVADSYRLVRNCIVHNGRRVDGKGANTLPFVTANLNLFSVRSNELVVLAPAYDDLFQTIALVFGRLVDELA